MPIERAFQPYSAYIVDKVCEILVVCIGKKEKLHKWLNVCFRPTSAVFVALSLSLLSHRYFSTKHIE
ncbi:hypothetical protein ALT785_580179 [Alteromonas infernus]|jgi:hypothetical protein